VRPPAISLGGGHRLATDWVATSFTWFHFVIVTEIKASRKLSRKSPSFPCSTTTLWSRPGGAKPGKLPVQQITKVELIVNLKAAKTLGVTFPLPLLGRADKVIE
jgi:hypothetical protein